MKLSLMKKDRIKSGKSQGFQSDFQQGSSRNMLQNTNEKAKGNDDRYKNLSSIST